MISYIRRLGRSVKADDVFFAWTSGDLRRMLAVLHLKTNPIDRHFVLMGIVSLTYKGRAGLAPICRTVIKGQFSSIGIQS
jgi:hypothetical protein